MDVGASMGGSSIDFLSLGRAEISLKNFALDSGFSETLAEVVLRAVSSAVTAVSYNGDNHLLVGFVAGEDLLEALRKGVEFAVTDGPVLKHFRLDLGKCEIASVHTVVSLLGSVLPLVREEFVSSRGHEVVDFRPSEGVGVASGLAAVASAL